MIKFTMKVKVKQNRRSLIKRKRKSERMKKRKREKVESVRKKRASVLVFLLFDVVDFHLEAFNLLGFTPAGSVITVF